MFYGVQPSGGGLMKQPYLAFVEKAAAEAARLNWPRDFYPRARKEGSPDCRPASLMDVLLSVEVGVICCEQ